MHIRPCGTLSSQASVYNIEEKYGFQNWFMLDPSELYKQ